MTKLSNAKRAARADQVIDAYGDDLPESNLIDLLADALHWCERQELGFNHLLEHASRHYLRELIDAGDGEGRRP